MEPNTVNGHRNMPAVIKTCPRCGAFFECLHAPQCWCAAIELTKKARRELAARYSGCLCPECLAAIAAGAPVESGRAH
jgi:ribosomal protein L34E